MAAARPGKRVSATSAPSGTPTSAAIATALRLTISDRRTAANSAASPCKSNWIAVAPVSISPLRSRRRTSMSRSRAGEEGVGDGVSSGPVVAISYDYSLNPRLSVIFPAQCSGQEAERAFIAQRNILIFRFERSWRRGGSLGNELDDRIRQGASLESFRNRGGNPRHSNFDRIRSNEARRRTSSPSEETHDPVEHPSTSQARRHRRRGRRSFRRERPEHQRGNAGQHLRRLPSASTAPAKAPPRPPLRHSRPIISSCR